MSEDKISVLVVANSTQDGSVSHLIQNEIRSLELVCIGVELFVVPSHHWKRLLSLPKFIQVVYSKYSDFNIIHFYTGSYFSLLLSLLIPFRVKFVSFGGSEILGYKRLGYKWYFISLMAKWTSVLLGVLSARIIVVSENIKNSLPSFLCPKIVVIPKGVDVDHFKPFNQNSKPVDILMIPDRAGSFVKNEALARKVVDELKLDFNELNVRQLKNIQWKDLPSVFNNSKVLLITSLHEGSPNVVKEAMACNTPIVSVPCGDVEFRLRNDSVSKVVDYDYQALKRACRDILSESRNQVLVSNGRECILQDGLDRFSTARKIRNAYLTTL